MNKNGSNNGKVEKIGGEERGLPAYPARGQGDIEPRIYEVSYHLLSTVSEDELPAEAAKVKDIVVSGGGVVLSEEEPKFMHLAYKMPKVIANKRTWFENAYFGWVKFEASEKIPAALKKFMSENANILRFLIIKTVRENTMVKKSLLLGRPAKPVERERGEVGERGGEKQAEPSLPINEAELDKTIEELVIQ